MSGVKGNLDSKLESQIQPRTAFPAVVTFTTQDCQGKERTLWTNTSPLSLKDRVPRSPFLGPVGEAALRMYVRQEKRESCGLRDIERVMPGMEGT